MKSPWGTLLSAVLLIASLTHCGGPDGAVSPEQVVQPPSDAQPDPATPPGQVTLLSFAFTGTLGVGFGTVDATWTYARTAEPSARDVRNLAPNVIYTLTAWAVTVHHDDLPAAGIVSSTVRFSNTLPGNTAEFCVGKCIFSPQHLENLYFSDGENSLHLAFTIPSVDPFLLVPPGTLDQWGPLYAVNAVNGGASWFESPQVIALLTGGTMSESPLAIASLGTSP